MLSASNKCHFPQLCMVLSGMELSKVKYVLWLQITLGVAVMALQHLYVRLEPLWLLSFCLLYLPWEINGLNCSNSVTVILYQQTGVWVGKDHVMVMKWGIILTSVGLICWPDSSSSTKGDRLYRLACLLTLYAGILYSHDSHCKKKNQHLK